jgi:NADH-quinone oxidoreductase subunit N
MWTPDVYDGAPTPVTGFMATGVKIAAFSGLARVLIVMFGASTAAWAPVLSGLAIASMVVGNLIALNQRSIKRMLAYSSIAHAGYLLSALIPGSSNGAAATLTYFLAYGLTSLAAFGLLAALGRDGERDVTLDTLAGLASRRPWVAAGLAVSMLSLLGFPGTLGFIGKWQILLALLGDDHGVVAVALVLTSLVSAGYYLPVIMSSYMRPPADTPVGSPLPAAAAFTVVLACVLVVVLGVWPTPALDLSLEGANSLLHASLTGLRAASP